MLRALYLKDFAIVTELELEFPDGLSVISGETGAGKSLLVDALGLVAGGRGDAAMVRHGAERAEIAAEITPNPAVSRWLTENDAPRAPCRTLPAPTRICRLTRNGISTSARRPKSPWRSTR